MRRFRKLKKSEWRATVTPLALYCQRMSCQYRRVSLGRISPGQISPGPSETRITHIERSARHRGAPVCDAAEGVILTTDPRESENAGHHGAGGGLRLPQPVDRK